MQVPVEMNRDASFKDLRNLLGRWMGAIPDNVSVFVPLCEVAHHPFLSLSC